VNPLGSARFSEWVAAASWSSIEFISDLHLSPQTPLTLTAWERYLGRTRASAVFILGDLFESWVGDDSRVDPFESRCVNALARASKHTALAFMVGNRDFLLGAAMCDACGMRALSDPTLLLAFGQRILLTHGDELCLEDVEYQKFRAMVRSAEWQAALLARPIAQRRDLAREMRAASALHQAQRGRLEEWADIDFPAAIEWLDRAQSDTLIHGHTHRPGTGPIGPGRVRHVLSDWSFDDAHAPRAEVLRLDSSGLTRHRVS
jgi:UDP-2,3-diacylglucosamine hydrolase